MGWRPAENRGDFLLYFVNRVFSGGKCAPTSSIFKGGIDAPGLKGEKLSYIDTDVKQQMQ